MKQKTVLKIPSMACRKCRSKVLSIAVKLRGVVSAGVRGEDNTRLEMIGEDVDIAQLLKLLRKKVGYAEIVSVCPSSVSEEGEKLPRQKPVVTRTEERQPPPQPQPSCSCHHHPCACSSQYGVLIPHNAYQIWVGDPVHCHEPLCSIL